MKAAVITGATSMLGIAAVKECIRHGVRVLALSRTGSRRKEALPHSDLVTFIGCDLSELLEIQVSGKYDVFYHFGWGYTNRIMRDNPVLQAKNIDFTLSAVELAHRLGCWKLIGAGSQAEYGFRDELTTEEAAVNPKNCYGYCKYAAGKLADKMCRDYGMACIWTRTFSVYGGNDSLDTMIPYALMQDKKGETALFSSGTQLWDFLHESDAGAYFYLLGERKVRENTVVNIASGDVRPLKEYIYEMAEVIREKGGREFQYKLDCSATDEKKGIYPDVTLLREITEYVPQVSFKEGISMLLENGEDDGKKSAY